MKALIGNLSYERGALLRIASGVLIEGGALGAYFSGIIHKGNLLGVSLAMGFFLVSCLAFFPLMRSAKRTQHSLVVSIFDRLFAIVGFTGAVYSLGDVEATYLIPIYFLYLSYYSIASPRKLPFTTATLSLVCFASAVLLEYFGILPHLNVLKDYNSPLKDRLAAIAVVGVLLYVGAALAEGAARLIRRGQAELIAQNVALETAKDKAQEADRLKSAFIAQISHDVRTPLHHIIGFTELTLDEARPNLSKSQCESLENVLKSGRHLLSLINDLLDISRLEAGKEQLVCSDLDLRSLLEDCVQLTQESAQIAQIQLRATFDDLPPLVWAEERRLRQVVYNLLSNAMKFTPPGGEVELRACSDGEAFVRVCVSDTGMGVERGDLERIFTPFERTTQANRFHGTGLGLSVARRLVELHGGRIWAESRGSGKGSRFCFTIRRLSETADE
jgi:signal transduction histidine kinase